MTSVHSVRERLAAGPARGLGCAPELAGEAQESPAILRDLVDALHDERAVVVARAANALKKVQGNDPQALDIWAEALLRAAMACPVLEARWNLWLVMGGLRLTPQQHAAAVDCLLEACASSSAFERVAAMQALADLSTGDPALRDRLRALLGRARDDASAAVRARARLLLRTV